MVKKLTQEHDPMSHIIESVRALCPAAVTDDGRIDIDVLKSELSDFAVSNLRERYEFVWVGKENAKREYKRKINKTLRPDIDASRDWSSTGNLYIEGDNLDALKLLQKSYSGRIKMIYIDPPYNTGNDFVYCDEYAEDCGEYLSKKECCDESGNRLYSNKRDGGHFHSNWCSMMYPRLCIARTLLSPDGVIFISIDDNEIANLKKICDEIFGENNAFPVFNRVTKKSSDSGNNFAPCMDYVLGYAKNISCVKEFKVELTDEIKQRYTKEDEYVQSRGPYQEVGLFQAALKHGGSSYYIECPDGQMVKPPRDLPWRWNEKTFLQGKKDGRIVFKATKSSPLITDAGTPANWNIYTKVYLKERADKGMHPKNFSDAFQNTLATNELNKLGIPFDFAKPSAFIQFLANICTEQNDIILDFFSGSGTTAHAVMQQNATDGGHRRFILVQLPETTDEKSEAYKSGYKTICDIGRERIRRAGTKIVSDTGQTDLDIGFRALRIDSSNMSDGIMSTPGQTVQSDLLSRVDNIKQGRGPLDLLFGVMIECGISLDSGIVTKSHHGQTYYSVNNGELIACFDNELSPELICEIARQKPMCAVFRDSSFADAKDKINVSEIFKNFCGDDKCLRIL